MRIGVIGYGYWGPNVMRNFVELVGTKGGDTDAKPTRTTLRIEAPRGA